jgi:hypothetical protein
LVSDFENFGIVKKQKRGVCRVPFTFQKNSFPLREVSGSKIYGVGSSRNGYNYYKKATPPRKNFENRVLITPGRFSDYECKIKAVSME